jgi:curved DNA-binding protein CbpA
MPSKTPAILLSSGSSVAALHYSAPPSTCASCRHSRPQTRTTRTQARSYAQHAPEPPSSSRFDDTDLTWPVPIPPNRTPTPYEILAVRRGDRYTKHRFYALAKLYHPDSCHASSPVAHVPHAVRLERYRLLVAAHGILSDDSKRRAYDLWGAGWTEPAQSTVSAHRMHVHRAWPPEHDPIHNATWEDWERWHRWNDGKPEDDRTVYMSNFGFMSLIFGIVSVGGFIQSSRASSLSSSVMEQRDKMHKEASIELARSKRATMTGDRKERIRTFLEHRDATLTGQEQYQRLLPPAENCAPESVRKQ